MAAYVDKSM